MCTTETTHFSCTHTESTTNHCTAHRNGKPCASSPASFPSSSSSSSPPFVPTRSSSAPAPSSSRRPRADLWRRTRGPAPNPESSEVHHVSTSIRCAKCTRTLTLIAKSMPELAYTDLKPLPPLPAEANMQRVSSIGSRVASSAGKTAEQLYRITEELVRLIGWNVGLMVFDGVESMRVALGTLREVRSARQRMALD